MCEKTKEWANAKTLTEAVESPASIIAFTSCMINTQSQTCRSPRFTSLGTNLLHIIFFDVFGIWNNQREVGGSHQAADQTLGTFDAFKVFRGGATANFAFGRVCFKLAAVLKRTQGRDGGVGEEARATAVQRTVQKIFEFGLTMGSQVRGVLSKEEILRGSNTTLEPGMTV